MKPREFALQVTERLQSAGYTALWAGGCVRDALLNRIPKDYDVATSATPDQVQDLFGHKKTLAIGKSFGVITVIGPKSAGPIEIATFRRDGGYSDGRRPDSIEFTDAREDALRRDFTINGMFYDPVKKEVIDYVGGKADIELGQVRAIGDPDARIEEDKLRMLRGIRFAATFGFGLESKTLGAIQKRATEIDAVSAERIGNEVRRMLSHENRAIALDRLLQSNLWSEIVPSVGEASVSNALEDWSTQRERVASFQGSDFATVLSLIFDREGLETPWEESKEFGPKFLELLRQAWRLTNDESDRMKWVSKNWRQLARADRLDDQPWSATQPLLLSPHASFTLLNVESREGASNFRDAVAFCRERLDWPSEKLDPVALIDGAALKSAGISPGPRYKELIGSVRQMQLDGEMTTPEQALAWVVGQVNSE